MRTFTGTNAAAIAAGASEAIVLDSLPVGAAVQYVGLVARDTLDDEVPARSLACRLKTGGQVWPENSRDINGALLAGTAERLSVWADVGLQIDATGALTITVTNLGPTTISRLDVAIRVEA